MLRFLRQNSSSLASFTELSGLVLSYSTTVNLSIGQTQHAKAQRDEQPKK